MGLDAVEFVLALEDAFGIAIPDEVAADLVTPRHVVDYLEGRLPAGVGSVCFSQRSFFRLRSAVMTAYQVPRSRVKLNTPWHEILPQRGPLRNSWSHLRNAVGAPIWPNRSFLGFPLSSGKTVGATAEYLATTTPHLFLASNEGWSRQDIEHVVRSLMETELSITEFNWDDRFV